MTNDERAALERNEQHALQQMARPVFEKNAKAMPFREDGERLVDYRIRLVKELQGNSRLRNADMTRVRQSELDEVERVVYADAEANYLRPLDLPPGQIREVVTTDHANRKIHEFATGAGKSGFRTLYRDLLGAPVRSAVFVDGEPRGFDYRG